MGFGNDGLGGTGFVGDVLGGGGGFGGPTGVIDRFGGGGGIDRGMLGLPGGGASFLWTVPPDALDTLEVLELEEARGGGLLMGNEVLGGGAFFGIGGTSVMMRNLYSTC